MVFWHLMNKALTWLKRFSQEPYLTNTMSKSLTTLIEEIQHSFTHLSEENIVRSLLLSEGISMDNKTSFPDPFIHYELIFTPYPYSSFPVLTLYNPQSPFRLISSGSKRSFTLLFQNEFLLSVTDFEERLLDLRKPEPHYFFVTEVNGDLVLKLNPIQMCDFFQNKNVDRPCSFCFRTDMVQRFTNLTATQLLEKIWQHETIKDNCQTLCSIDEISLVTGSYSSDDRYLKEVSTLINGLKAKIRPDLRVVVGSHEGKSLTAFETLKNAGVTHFAFPIESLDDAVRSKQMKNRKGIVEFERLLESIELAIKVFGTNGIIIRLVAGLGDSLNSEFKQKVSALHQLFPSGTHAWNINQYMPFTHYHWRLFQKQKPFDQEYLWRYYDIINSIVPKENLLRFKVSP